MRGFNYVVISPYNPTKRETYRGPDAGKVFLERILAEEKEILKKMDKADEPMIMTEVDHQKFNNSDTCYICNELFVEYRDGLIIPSLKGEKVRDHCHYTGQGSSTLWFQPPVKEDHRYSCIFP